MVTALLAACGHDDNASTTTTPAVTTTVSPTTPPSATPSSTSVPKTTLPDHGTDRQMDPADHAAAMLATAAFQDVTTAQAAGYATSLETLGCFQNPGHGGMGVHYVNQQLLDDQVDVTKPEALVYELNGAGQIIGLVAHEYIVPIEAWTSSNPPSLFGMEYHKHPTLPLWVLHTWLWKLNPTGIFQDWNPAVRLCPAGVPIFGTDLPTTPTTVPATVAPNSQSRLGPR
jgi:hypothetical protein